MQLAVAIGAGLAVRVALVLCTAPAGADAGDLNVYHRTALQLIQDTSAWMQPGGEFGYRPPLYPAYLWLFYSLAEVPDYRLGQLANLLLVPGMLWLFHRVLVPAFGSRVALAAVWVRALLPPFVVSDLFVMSEVLFDLLLLWAVVLLQGWPAHGRRLSRSLLLGVVTGLLALTRELAVGFLLLVPIGVAALEPAPLRRKLAWALVFWLGAVLSLAPWLARNQALRASPLPVALTSGPNLHLGNHPDATGSYAEFRHPDHVHPTDLPFGTLEAERWHRQRALEWMRENPLRVVELVPARLGYFVWPRTLRTELLRTDLFPGIADPLKQALVVGGLAVWSAIWLLGLLGLLLRDADRYAIITGAVLLYLCALVALTIGAPRFADPVILLLIGPALACMRERRLVLQRIPSSAPRVAVTGLAVAALLGLWVYMGVIRYLG
jgi:4-amino-4-deoxy-L-arabinose transferase-like glycosyltransferase